MNTDRQERFTVFDVACAEREQTVAVVESLVGVLRVRATTAEEAVAAVRRLADDEILLRVTWLAEGRRDAEELGREAREEARVLKKMIAQGPLPSFDYDLDATGTPGQKIAQLQAEVDELRARLVARENALLMARLHTLREAAAPPLDDRRREAADRALADLRGRLTINKSRGINVDTAKPVIVALAEAAHAGDQGAKMALFDLLAGELMPEHVTKAYRLTISPGSDIATSGIYTSRSAAEAVQRVIPFQGRISGEVLNPCLSHVTAGLRFYGVVYGKVRDGEIPDLGVSNLPRHVLGTFGWFSSPAEALDDHNRNARVKRMADQDR